MRISQLEGRRVALWGWGREGRAAHHAVRSRLPALPLTLFCNAQEAAEAATLGDPLAQIRKLAEQHPGLQFIQPAVDAELHRPLHQLAVGAARQHDEGGLGGRRMRPHGAQQAQPIQVLNQGQRKLFTHADIVTLIGEAFTDLMLVRQEQEKRC